MHAVPQHGDARGDLEVTLEFLLLHVGELAQHEGFADILLHLVRSVPPSPR